MPRATPHPRRIVFLLFLPILGAATALFIAIACGLCIDPPYGFNRGHVAIGRTFIQDGRPWSVAEWRCTGATVALWCEITRDFFTVPPPAGPPDPPPAAHEDAATLLHDYLASEDAENAAAGARRSQFPRSASPGVWGTFARGFAPASLSDAEMATGAFVSGSDFGYGWPFIALWFQSSGSISGSFQYTTASTGGTVVSGKPEVGMNCRCRVIPYTPAWPGLLADAAIYTALWSLLLLAPRPIRRALRLRRGQCPHCAYDLRATPANLPCPECGRPNAP